MKADGNIVIDTKINSDGMQRGISEIKGSMTKLGGIVKGIGKTIIAAFAIKQIVQFGKECLELGSDLAEVQNVVDVTFPSMTKQVDEFAKAAADSFGLSETMAKKYVGTFGAMSKSFGYSESAAYDMATALTGLTGDVASFYNLSQEEAYTKLKSVFTGETESLKELGVVMTQSALDQYALANGFGKTTNKMTEQEKVALRLQFVQNQLSAASGDFARTSDSWANQVRIFQLRLQSLKATIGQGLINLFTPIIKAINVFLERLSTATTAFKNFTETVMGKKSVNSGAAQAAGEMAEVQAGYEGAADGAEDFADGVKDAGKQVKKSLAPFDNLIQIQRDAEEGSENTGDSSIMPPGLSPDEQQTESPFLKNVMETLEAIKQRLIEIGGIFQSGFWQGLGDYKPVLDSIKTNIASIGNSLKDIFTDQGVMSAFNTMLDTISYNLGRTAGSFASVGLTIADNLTGGIALYLESAKDRIKGYLISMFDITSEISTIGADFAVAVADIFSVFRSDTAKQITADIIAIFADIFMGITELSAKLFRDVLDTILTPFVENKDKIKEALTNTMEPIKTVLDSISQGITETFENLNKMYDEHIAPLFESIKNGLSEILGNLLDGYNKYIAPTLQKLADKFSEVYEGTIQPLINKIIELMGKVADLIKVIWDEYLKPLLSWISSNILPVVAPILETIGTYLLNLIDTAASVLDGLITAFSGIIDFLTGVFSGDWEKAWEGIKEIFGGVIDAIMGLVEGLITSLGDFISGGLESIGAIIETALNGLLGAVEEVWKRISSTVKGLWDALKGDAQNIFEGIGQAIESVWDSVMNKTTEIWNSIVTVIKNTIAKIVSGIEGMVNSVISGINKIIEAINRVMDKVGIAIPTIPNLNLSGKTSYPASAYAAVPFRMPMLATGTVVPPRAGMFAAILGDNNRETEVVSPLSTMKQALKEALAESNIALGNQIATAELVLDGTKFGQLVVKFGNNEKNRVGVRMVTEGSV
ncbi:hypothetical protein DXC92_05045 [Clostridiales bacterium TF09-2AC]|nr:hypothetical protein DXC92_05045 [Clostridiales bacterium TF09-2AC]